MVGVESPSSDTSSYESLLSPVGGSSVSGDAARPSTRVCKEVGVLAAILDLDLVTVMTGEEELEASGSVMTGPPPLLVLDPSPPPGPGLQAT